MVNIATELVGTNILRKHPPLPNRSLYKPAERSLHKTDGDTRAVSRRAFLRLCKRLGDGVIAMPASREMYANVVVVHISKPNPGVYLCYSTNCFEFCVGGK